jgi:signal transduction histidine kinase
VTVSLARQNGKVVLRVKDNGQGIPKILQPNVFTKFFRAPEAVSIEANGNGLGLYMAKQMANALNGQMSFKSTFGKGSTFYLKI